MQPRPFDIAKPPRAGHRENPRKCIIGPNGQCGLAMFERVLLLIAKKMHDTESRDIRSRGQTHRVTHTRQTFVVMTFHGEKLGQKRMGHRRAVDHAGGLPSCGEAVVRPEGLS